MVALLLDNPLLLLFAVAAVGYVVGRIRIRGFGLGVAAVLFVGLAFGALDPEMHLPEVVTQLGLVLFVYCVGLTSGPGFVQALGRRGLRANLLVAGAVLGAAGLIALAAVVLGLSGATAAGLFAGALTNTPALAAVVDATGGSTDPVVAYSVAYPVGVVGVLAAIFLTQRWWKVDYRTEAASSGGTADDPLAVVTVEVGPRVPTDVPLVAHAAEHGWAVTFGRLRHAGEVSLVTASTRVAPGDLVNVVGTASQVSAAVDALGTPSAEHLELDRSVLDFRRMFVSSPQVAGRALGELDLARHHASVTRVRRGDTDLVATADTVLELGDRVRVVAPRHRMPALAQLFGDSYRAVSEFDVTVFAVGIALGLLLGLVPVPLPGGGRFTLGIAGGPLVVGLALGAAGRSGRVLWQLPYPASTTLQQLGMVLFLAGVGTRSGWAFASTLGEGGGLTLFVAGAVTTCLVAFATLLIGHRWLRIPMGTLIGHLAGLQTQPAVLAFAREQAGEQAPNLGYAAVYPTAMVLKIVVAQLLLSVTA